MVQRQDVADIMITIILELSTTNQQVVEKTADVVNHFFLATQNEGRKIKQNLYGTCVIRTSAIHNADRMFVSTLPHRKLRRSQLCLSDSLSLSAVPGHLVRRSKYQTFEHFSSKVRPAPLYLECNRSSMCEFPVYEWLCILHFAEGVTTDEHPDRMFMIDAAREVHK
ncbi:hypothetical protein MRX96_021020 [Rhipicephalus microplus]